MQEQGIIQSAGSSYLRCLLKAMRKTESLFCRDAATADYDEVHAAKSLLYAAIERAGIEIERSSLVHQKLRALLPLIAMREGIAVPEREEALRILESLRDQIYFLAYPRVRETNLF